MEIFVEHFITKGGYKVALEGLLVTAQIAVFGLIVGILLGTLIAIVKVMPKYKTLPKVLDAICSVYVGFFRGTPMVVQLLVGYYVLFPAMNIRLDGVVVAILIFGAYGIGYDASQFIYQQF